LAKACSLSSLKGGEGRGEEANRRRSQAPLTPALSPLGRGEGVASGWFTRINGCDPLAALTVEAA